jgi:hypothetical protein
MSGDIVELTPELTGLTRFLRDAHVVDAMLCSLIYVGRQELFNIIGVFLRNPRRHVFRMDDRHRGEISRQSD